MRSLIFTLIVFAISIPAQADIILFEDFEDATISYTTSVPDDLSDIATRDYFGRISPGTTTPPVDISYSNLQGTGYYGAQDTDSANSGNIDQIAIEWIGIDISNFDNLGVSWMVAEDTANDGNEDWDTSSSFKILVQIDDGGFQNLFWIQSEIGSDGNETNEAPRVDTDFDGTGDGTAITDVFTLFSSGISNGSMLDIRVVIEDLDSGDEDIAFDNLLLTGDSTAIPEPSSAAFLIAVCAFFGIRRRNLRR